MATKTLTITEDAYNLLKQRKHADESFSQEITRILTQRKTQGLMRFFGILSKKEGKEMLDQLKKDKELEIQAAKERIW